MPPLLLLPLLLGPGSPVGGSGGSGEFGYDGSGGPAHWSDAYAQCAGKFQSPIDIEEHLVRHVRLPPLRMRELDAAARSCELVNNGHTVMLRMTDAAAGPAGPAVEGGPLAGRYLFQQLHFHWGSNNSVGSEATVNNHSFPLELHMVFIKEAYGSMQEAMQHSDGLVVIGLFYEVYGPDNPAYSALTEAVPLVTEAGSRALLPRQLALGSLLPSNRILYFSYNGSLTTPPCSEVVTWIEFKQPILLSETQVAVFRTLHSAHGRMTHNYRPVQPLSGRLVLFNVGDQPSNQPSSSPVADRPAVAVLAASLALSLALAGH